MKTEMENTYQLQPSISTCGLLATMDFSRIADGAMNDTEMERFVQHCEECDDCSRALWDYQKAKIDEQEEIESDSVVQEAQTEYSSVRIQEQDERLIRRSLDFLDKLRNS